MRVMLDATKPLFRALLLNKYSPQLISRKLFKHIVLAYGYCQWDTLHHNTFATLITIIVAMGMLMYH